MCEYSVGIDPGANGYFSSAYTLPPQQVSHKLPFMRARLTKNTYGNLIDVLELKNITRLKCIHSTIIIEAQSGRPMNGQRSNDALMRNYGMILSYAFRIFDQVGIVQPAEWKKRLIGKSKTDKADSIAYALKAFKMEEKDLCPGRKRVPDHNLAESLIMLDIARQHKRYKFGSLIYWLKRGDNY